MNFVVEFLGTADGRPNRRRLGSTRLGGRGDHVLPSHYTQLVFHLTGPGEEEEEEEEEKRKLT